MKKIIFVFTILALLSCEQFSKTTSTANTSEVPKLSSMDVSGKLEDGVLTPEQIKERFAKLPKLSSHSVKRYIKTYEFLLENAPKVIELINENQLAEAESHSDFAKMKQILQQENLSFEEFVGLNRKIASIYTLTTAEEGIGFSMSIKAIDQQIKSLQEELKTEEVPEQAKELTRKSIKDLEKMKRQLEAVENSKKWKEKVKKARNKLMKKLPKMVDMEEYKLVKRYAKTLEELYNSGEGMPPLIFN